MLAIRQVSVAALPYIGPAKKAATPVDASE